MFYRPAYPDELGRAANLLEGHLVPASAHFLLAVKEYPVERLVAAIASWPAPCPEGEKHEKLLFALGLTPSLTDLAVLEEFLPLLTARAQEQSLNILRYDTPLAEAHPYFPALTEHGFTIAQTDRHFCVPGEIFKQHSLRDYLGFQEKIPTAWTVSSLRGQNPDALFRFVVQHGLISPQAFQNYWKTGQHEHFEDAYSKLLLDGETIIGAFLVSQRGKEELHIHVEASAPEYQSQSGLISATLRHASFSQCAEGFPKIFTLRADSKKHPHTANTALRQGGTELPPHHLLEKPVGCSIGQA